MVIGLGAALLAALLFGVGAVAQAIAARRHGLLSLMMLLVAGVYLVGWVFHLVAIVRTPLYVAQVGTALSLAITALAATVLVGEPLGRRHWVAIGGQVTGLALLALAAGPVGGNRFDTPRTAALWVALVLVTLLGLAARRTSGHTGGLALATVAGVAYAGSPIATRALVHPTWTSRMLLAATTIGLFGLVGFWLYSEALKRTSVTASTAPVILLQTLLPSAVGLVVFGDQVRAGWWPAALVGFVVSTAGALALCDAEARLEHLEGLGRDPMVGWVHDER